MNDIKEGKVAMPVQTSITTFREGTCPELIKLGGDTFQCPMCHKVGPYHALIPHLQGHQRSVVKYGGYNVYKCHLKCVANSHYHCNFCSKIIVRKELFLNHIKICIAAVAVTAVPSPTALATMGPPLTPVASVGSPVTLGSSNSPGGITSQAGGSITFPGKRGITGQARGSITFPGGSPVKLEALSHSQGGSPVTLEAPSHSQGESPVKLEAPSHSQGESPVKLEAPSHSQGESPVKLEAPSHSPGESPIKLETPSHTLVGSTLLTGATMGPKTSTKKITAPKMLLSKRKKTTCCFCNLRLLKKNAKAHIQRRHASKQQGITANRYLESVCTDKKGAFLQF
ncbi:Neurofilament heavy polypeptide [Merluccius polli]|uniref:Neurofilament heavy polypeptide n=1 Tax=Merluccius polli TaxID=89951 RepID=A0AA47NR67_MERPO|nr:Neurofilament heavy polypeptide [Merluccius polli]